MTALSDTPGPEAPAWSPGLHPVAASIHEEEVQRLAQVFAVTPAAARLAVQRVGTDFRDLQRELGGRR